MRAVRKGWRPRRFEGEGGYTWLFCENDTNTRCLFGSGQAGPLKDGINDFVVHGDRTALSPDDSSTKCAAHARFVAPPGERVQLRARLRTEDGKPAQGEFHAVLSQDIADPDRKGAWPQPGLAAPEQRRRALDAG